MDSLGGPERRDLLTDNVRLQLTALGAELINNSPLGKRQPAVAGGNYVAPLWEILAVLTASGKNPTECVKNKAAFDLLVQ